jgi:hypothetical protein
MNQCRCTAKNSWWWAERLPETPRVVISIKLEFSASVGFIHKQFVTMHGHTILKLRKENLSHFNKTWSLSRDFQQSIQTSYFMQKRRVGAELFHADKQLGIWTAGQKGRQAGRHNEAHRGFSQFCERAWSENIFKTLTLWRRNFLSSNFSTPCI